MVLTQMQSLQHSHYDTKVTKTRPTNESMAPVIYTPVKPTHMLTTLTLISVSLAEKNKNSRTNHISSFLIFLSLCGELFKASGTW